jgi:tellurite resistance protein
VIRLTPTALAGLRNRLRERGARPSIVLPPTSLSTRDDLLASALSEQYGPFCDAMYLVMAADRKIEGSERDVIRGALRELDDRIRSYHVESMLMVSQQELEAEGQAPRMRAIAEAIGDERPRAEAAFLLAAAVAYADNELAPEEHEVLSQLIAALGIDSARATELFNGSLEHVDAVLGGSANVDAADVAVHAAMRLHTPEDFERLAATTDRPDVTLMLRLFASFVRTGEEMRDRASSTPRSLASARAHAVKILAETIPEGRGAHVDEVRSAIAMLGDALCAVDAVATLPPLLAEQGPKPPIVGLEHAIARLSRITTNALRRCGEMAPDAPAITGELRAAVEAVVANQQAARSTLASAIDLTVQRARRSIPSAILEAIELVLRRLVELPPEASTQQVAAAPAPTPSAPPLPEWVVAYQRKVGGFFVLDSLGAGGTGSVFAVTRYDEREDAQAQRFALKVPRYDAIAARSISEAEFLKHFRQEAGALLALPDHANLAAFINFDARAKPWPVLVMELVEGTDCGKLLDAKKLSATAVIRILDGLLAGLSVMHEAGIGHLDLKPSNVVLRPDGTPAIVDFGLAGRHIRPGCATAAYAPPEVWGYQEKGAPPATPLAADVYSFGCMAYELLSGRTLFEGPHDLAMLALHMDHDGGPQSIKRLKADPRHVALGDWLSACLRQNASARPKVDELRKELHRIGPYLASMSWPLDI